MFFPVPFLSIFLASLSNVKLLKLHILMFQPFILFHGLHVYFCASAILVLLLWLSNIIFRSGMVVLLGLFILLRIVLSIWALL